MWKIPHIVSHIPNLLVTKPFFQFHHTSRPCSKNIRQEAAWVRVDPVEAGGGRRHPLRPGVHGLHDGWDSWQPDRRGHLDGVSCLQALRRQICQNHHWPLPLRFRYYRSFAPIIKSNLSISCLSTSKLWVNFNYSWAINRTAINFDWNFGQNRSIFSHFWFSSIIFS